MDGFKAIEELVTQVLSDEAMVAAEPIDHRSDPTRLVGAVHRRPERRGTARPASPPTERPGVRP